MNSLVFPYEIAEMRILILFQIFALSCCDSTVKEYLDAVAKFSNENLAAQHFSSGGGNQAFQSSTLKNVDKEHFLAFKKFKDNVDFINKDDNIPFSAALNKFSIMTELERQLYTGLNVSMMEEEKEPYNLGMSTENLKALPKSIDWVERGAQVGIKQQGECGSCWAFAGISAIEASYFQVTGELKSFSEQELLDCTYEGSNRDGCDGGWLDHPINYVKKADRLALRKNTGYLGRDGPCRYRNIRNSLTEARVVGVKKFAGDKGLKEAVSKGVTTVALFVTDSFYTYDKGIYQERRCTKRPNHAITVVGYGSSKGKNFWHARNSWGTTWGEKGYMKITRDLPNHCSIAMSPFLAVMKCRKPGCKNNNRKTKCENVWPDFYCNASGYYCRRQKEGKDKEFQIKLQKNCRKSCNFCDSNSSF